MKFYPALSGPQALNYGQLPPEYLWWREECPVHIPKLLISYGILLILHGKVPINTRSDLKAENVEVMVDSGGYQIMTKGISIDVEALTRWQMQNGDYIIALDVPVAVKDMGDIDKLVKHAKKSAENYATQIKIMGDIAREKLFLPLHGRYEHQYEKWWEIAIEPFLDKVFGVALALRVKNAVEVVRGLNYLKSKGVKNVHLLAATGFKMMTAAMLFNKHFKFLSTDSSTFSMLAARGGIFPPYTRGSTVKVGRKGMKTTSYDGLECRCPACARFLNGQVGNALKLNSLERYAVIMLHNLYWMASFIDYLHWLERFGGLEDFAEKTIPKAYQLYRNPSSTASGLSRWL